MITKTDSKFSFVRSIAGAGLIIDLMPLFFASFAAWIAVSKGISKGDRITSDCSMIYLFSSISSGENSPLAAISITIIFEPEELETIKPTAVGSLSEYKTPSLFTPSTFSSSKKDSPNESFPILPMKVELPLSREIHAAILDPFPPCVV